MTRALHLSIDWQRRTSPFTAGSYLCFTSADAALNAARQGEKPVKSEAPTQSFMLCGGGAAGLCSLHTFCDKRETQRKREGKIKDVERAPTLQSRMLRAAGALLLMFAVETPPFVAVRLPRSLFKVCLFVVFSAAFQLITVKWKSESMEGKTKKKEKRYFKNISISDRKGKQTVQRQTGL